MFCVLKKAGRVLWDTHDTLLELVIIVMIKWEIHEENRQYCLLEQMIANTAANVAAMKELRTEHAKSLTDMNKTCR
jgi:hypothetical protein